MYKYYVSVWTVDEELSRGNKNSIHNFIDAYGNKYPTFAKLHRIDEATLKKIWELIEADNAVKGLLSTTKNDLEVDCISRADVLKLIRDNWHSHSGDWAMQESIDAIRVMPSVTPQEPRWIPVSERLPEKNVEVLATTIGDVVIIAEMFSVNDWYECATNAKADEIVAWMPLPKPYEPQESEE